MATPINGTKNIEQCRSTLAFENPDNAAQNHCGGIPQQEVDVVGLSSKLDNTAIVAKGGISKNSAEQIQPLVGECAASKFRTKDNMNGQMVDTVACCVKVKIPDSLTVVLETIEPLACLCTERMLAHRELSSSKFYPELPCVIAKSLIAKYQRNRKCRRVMHLVLPICGDKGKQIKLEGKGVRVPALFRKEVLPVMWMRQPVGFIRSVEFFKRGGDWFAAICYNARKEPTFRSTGTVGVDRNSVGAVATLADPQNGKVLHLGFNPARTKEVWGRRKANLQSLGKRRLLRKIRNKQSRHTKYENHVVSKQIVDYAAKHRRTIVLEKLDNVRRGKIRRYAEKSQWSFRQLLQFILYKSALRGVMVLEVDSAYTSQECSRCHQLSKPNGKSFRCGSCGHNDHQDANAAFSLSERVMPIGGVVRESESPHSALLVEPFLGTEVQQCT
jgi:IS605 OrfB family transposase